jgi:hypothetical protein
MTKFKLETDKRTGDLRFSGVIRRQDRERMVGEIDKMMTGALGNPGMSPSTHLAAIRYIFKVIGQ